MSREPPSSTDRSAVDQSEEQPNLEATVGDFFTKEVSRYLQRKSLVATVTVHGWKAAKRSDGSAHDRTEPDDGSRPDRSPGSLADEHDRRQPEKPRNPTTTAELPVAEATQQMLSATAYQLGERWLGQPWSLWLEHHVRHAGAALDAVGTAAEDDLVICLTNIRVRSGGTKVPFHRLETAPWQDQVLCALLLWWQCFDLWDRALPYRTLRVIEHALARVAEKLKCVPPEVRHALQAAMAIIVADTEVFRCINLSDTKRTIDVLAFLTGSGSSVDLDGPPLRTMADLRRTLTHAISTMPKEETSAAQLVRKGLEHVLETLDTCSLLYERVLDAAYGVAEYEGSLARARSASADSHVHLIPAADAAETTKSLRKRAEFIRSMPSPSDEMMLSRLNPWVRLLQDMADSLETDGDEPARIFVPSQVSLRYCFPFAVDLHHESVHHKVAERRRTRIDWALRPKLLDLDGNPNEIAADILALDDSHDSKSSGAALLMTRLQELLNREITSRHPMKLSAFWQGAGDFLYGGISIALPDILIGKGYRFGAWIELHRTTNHCLCIQLKKPLQASPTGSGNDAHKPLPQVLYRLLRLPSPYVFGEPVRLDGKRFTSREVDPRWDSLNYFAKDVIREITAILADPTGKEKAKKTASSFRGSVHEVMVLETDEPIGETSRSISDFLDEAIGGELITRPVHRTASTLAEWIRFPNPLRGTDIHSVDEPVPAQINRVPEIGFAGEWYSHTGDTSVFGVVGAPSWLTDIYFEVAQSAATWRVLMQMWNIKLEQAVRSTHGVSFSSKHSKQLRVVEENVRRSSAQMRSKQLCASTLHRRFLDEFLAAANVFEEEEGLERHLQATQRLIDWHTEERRRLSERSRNALLLLIGSFSIFGLVSYFELIDRIPSGHRLPLLFNFFPHHDNAEIVVTGGIALIVLIVAIVLLIGIWRKPWIWVRTRWQMRRGA